MYKENLALNNLKWLISHKTKPKQFSVKLLFLLFGWNSSWFYNILDAHANFSGYISSSLPLRNCTLTHHLCKFSLLPIQCMWSRFLLACQLCNLRCLSAENTSVLFILGIKCLSSYFCSRYSTSAAASSYQYPIFPLFKFQNHYSYIVWEVYIA